MTFARPRPCRFVCTISALSLGTWLACPPAARAQPMTPPQPAPASAAPAQEVITPEDIARIAPEIARFAVRDGYRVELAVTRLDNARFMEFSPDGSVLYVSRPRAGDIVALRDRDGDGLYDFRQVFVDGLPSVHGLHWHKDHLWFTTSGGIFKALDEDRNDIAEEVQLVIDGLPEGGAHWWRSILVTDEHIFTSIGDSGNITDESATDRQKIWRFTHTGADKTLWATGLRNTEKLRLRPGTSEVWGVDHGSDNFGETLGENGTTMPFTDHNPPDELNLYEQGGFYGHPFITGMMVPRPEFATREDLLTIAQRTRVPMWNFGAHWSANSFTFIDPAINARTGAFPADHAGDLFVACRGSWNRSERAGYQIARVHFEKDPAFATDSRGNARGTPVGLTTIVRTMELRPDGDHAVLGRPVDVVQNPTDGTLLFSVDLPMGRIYRIRWVGDDKPAQANEPARPFDQPRDNADRGD